MPTITISISESDEKVIKDNVYNLSLQLGYRLNVSDLLRYVLKTHNTKHALFNLGYISILDLYESTPTFKKGKRRLKNLKPR